MAEIIPNTLQLNDAIHSKINQQSGWDLNVWARREYIQDMAIQNNKENVHNAVVPDEVVSVSLKCHLSCMTPLCTSITFKDLLEQQKLSNNNYFESPYQAATDIM